MSNYCSIPGCGKQETVFHFPNPKKDFQRYMQWVKAAGNKKIINENSEKVYKNRAICLKHFVETEVLNHGQRKRLKPLAVPTLYLPNESLLSTGDSASPTKQTILDLPSTSSEKYLADCVFITPEKEAAYWALQKPRISREHIEIGPGLLAERKLQHSYSSTKGSSARSTLHYSLGSKEVSSSIAKTYQVQIEADLEVEPLNPPQEKVKSCKGFSGEPNEVNSQLALLQKCEDSEEMKLFGGEFFTPTSTVLEETVAMDDAQKMILENNVDQENIDPGIKYQKPYFQSVKCYLEEDQCFEDVCRICFSAIKEEDVIRLNDENIQIKEMLQKFLPDLDLEIYQNSVICLKCNYIINSSFELQQTWLATEQKLQRIIESEIKNPNMINSNLVLMPEAVNVIDKIDHDVNDKTGVQTDYSIDWSLGPYLCELCGKIFDKVKLFRRHRMRHLEKLSHEQLMCESCGDIFDTLSDLKRHATKTHKELKEKPTIKYSCPFCNKLFSSKPSLQTHINHRHYKSYNYAQCHICGKKFVSKGILRAHLVSHYPPRFSCDICNRKFHYLGLLKKHLIKHSTARLECEFCGKKIKYKAALKQHIEIFHENKGRFRCEFCEKLYWKRCDLIKHRFRIHGA